MTDLNRLAGLAGLALVATAPVAAQTAAERLGLPAPADRDGTTVSVNGADIFYSDSGEGDAIVLLHGYPLSGALFERVRDDLDDDHRVITIDHRGYGNSTTPEPVTDVATYAEDALAVMGEIGVENAIIGGMSMGGPILFEMFRQNPDVFRAAILIDTNHRPANPIEAGIWNGAKEMLEADGISAIAPVLLPDMLTGETRTLVAPAQADYLTQVMEQASVDGALGGATVLANRPDSTETLGQMDVPTLVLVGRADSLYPVAISEAMVDALPNGTLAIVEEASHAAIFEQPDDRGRRDPRLDGRDELTRPRHDTGERAALGAARLPGRPSRYRPPPASRSSFQVRPPRRRGSRLEVRPARGWRRPGWQAQAAFLRPNAVRPPSPASSSSTLAGSGTTFTAVTVALVVTVLPSRMVIPSSKSTRYLLPLPSVTSCGTPLLKLRNPALMLPRTVSAPAVPLPVVDWPAGRSKASVALMS